MPEVMIEETKDRIRALVDGKPIVTAHRGTGGDREWDGWMVSTVVPVRLDARAAVEAMAAHVAGGR